MKQPDISLEIWNQNYQGPNEQTLMDTWERQAKACAEIEDESIREKIYKDFLWLLTDFKGIAGGRITANLGIPGREATTLMNCYVHNPGDINFEDPDSIKGIYSMLEAQAQTLKSEGGYGMNFSWIRPGGSYVKGIDGRTPGVLKFMELWDKSSEIITMGSEKITDNRKQTEKKKIRKGAQMGVLSVWHPEIEDFIDAKLVPNRLTKFNISVGITDGFMNAVINDDTWNLRFPDTNFEKYKTEWNGDIYDWESKNYPVIVYKTVKASELWEKIMKATYTRNDPGVLFLDIANKLNPLAYGEKILTSNPCFHADTLIAVADGRNFVSIKQLAEEGKDVPVYSVDKKTGKVSIQMGRNPRMTGFNQKLVRVVLDDGTYLDVTPNHKFYLLNGEEKKAKDLLNGDSLPRFTKNKECVKEGGKPYYRINCNVFNSKKDRVFEHRLIAKFFYPKLWNKLYKENKKNGWINGGIVVHHKDFNQINNVPENLEIMTFSEHSKFHAKIIHSGENNGRFSGVSFDEIKEHAIKLTKNLGRKFSITEWQTYAKENKLPQSFSKFRKDKFGNISQLAIWAATELGLCFVNEDPRLLETYKNMLEQGYNAIIDNNTVYVEKKCEQCDKIFLIQHLKRETSCCSFACGQNKFYTNKVNNNINNQAKIYSDLKFRLNRVPFKKEWENECKKQNIPIRFNKKSKYGSFGTYKELKKFAEQFNHKVLRVEELPGYHAVYNITVDYNHTVGIVTNSKDNLSGIFTPQCGEILMSTGVCNLFSLNLVRFLIVDSEDKYHFDFDTFKKAVSIAIRFSDNINDISRAPLPEYKYSMLEKRRIGVGVLGLGSLMYILGIRFGSDESLDLIDKIFKTKCETELLTSALLGKEKGSFKLFDKEKYFSSYWWKTLPISDKVKKQIEEIGEMRNSHHAANAPTGNMSIYAGVVSGGIEPVYMKEYARWSIVPEHIRAELREKGFEFPDIFKGEWFETKHLQFSKRGTDEVLFGSFGGINYQVDKNRGLTKQSIVEDYGWKFVKEHFTQEQISKLQNENIFVTTEDLSVDDHIKTLKVISKYVNMNSSKTVNIPSNYPYDDFKHLYINAWKSNIKGITSYRAGTMTAVLENINATNSENIDSNTKEKTRYAESRNKVLESETHKVKLDSGDGDLKNAYVTVSFFPNSKNPYEVFINAPTRNDSKDLQILELTSRMTSLALRHNIPVDFVISQLNKIDGQYIYSIPTTLAKILTRYIDGNKLAEMPKIENQTKMIDNSCKHENKIFEEGCFKCLDCGFSACS